MHHTWADFMNYGHLLGTPLYTAKQGLKDLTTSVAVPLLQKSISCHA